LRHANQNTNRLDLARPVKNSADRGRKQNSNTDRGSQYKSAER
jgi:hypothetical protein